jgi:hypothetical protein
MSTQLGFVMFKQKIWCTRPFQGFVECQKSPEAAQWRFTSKQLDLKAIRWFCTPFFEIMPQTSGEIFMWLVSHKKYLWELKRYDSSHEQVGVRFRMLSAFTGFIRRLRLLAAIPL